MHRSSVLRFAIASATGLLLFLAGCAGTPIIDGRFIEHAAVEAGASAKAPAGDRLAPAVRLLSTGHLLTAGAGSVLQLYRQRTDRESGMKGFELITIALPEKPRRGRFDLKTKALSATYSYSSGGDRLEAHGRSLRLEGELLLQGRGSGLLVELEAEAFLDGGYRRRLSWNAQLPAPALYDYRAWPTTTWTEGIWFLSREADADS